MSLDVDSRPLTPESQLANSLHRATSTIDELTQTLTSVSRLSSPEPDNAAACVCCCGRADCETSKAWATMKAKLESRLVLSAEVGRALLERHEALVRRQRQESAGGSTEVSDASVDSRVAELVKQNAVLEKRLTQALMHTEVSETSKKALIQNLEEAKTDVARLSSQNARAVGLENRLAMALQEQDDLKQELDSATQRAKLTESRVVSYREKCAKLQAQVARLREDVNMQRSHRHEFSEEILNDARQRLEQLQHHKFGHAAEIHDSEVTKVLESLVADNEVLKRDNAELQNLLAQEREELHTLQEELEERRASDTPFRPGHRFTQSGASFTFHDTSGPLSPSFQIGTAPTGSALRARMQGEKRSAEGRSLSAERTRRPFEPLTPETETSRRPLSPAESHFAAGTKWTSFSRHRYAPSQISYEVGDSDGDVLSAERPQARKPLFLLTRERGVQTDAPSGGDSILSPSPIPRAFGDQVSSHEGHSEASSLTDNIHSTAIGTLVDRTTTLFSRLSQADALTLTNRLKRQHLLGADVGHISRTTVNAVVNDVTALRGHFRAFLEDEKTTTTCTRRDLRSLLKLFKDVFTELGQMRITLNDVILDPTIAGKVSEMAMHPSKAQTTESEAAGGPGASWIAPISKLLGLPGGSGANAPSESSAAARALSPSARNFSGARGRPQPRVAPKLQPALSASAMTVNVEFSGAGVGRSVTSTHSAHPSRATFGSLASLPAPVSATSSSSSTAPIAQPVPRQDISRSVMGIFAGAPRPAEKDPWVVIPRPPGSATSAAPSASISRKVTRTTSMNVASTATIGRSSLRPGHGGAGRRLSRIVDAVIDSPHVGGENEEPVSDGSGGPPPALERALRRGLSDSSIRTTFTQHGGEEDSGTGAADEGGAPPPDRESVLQALSRKMQAFRFSSAAPTDATTPAAAPTSRPQTPTAKQRTGGQPSTPKRSPPKPIPPPRSKSTGPSGSEGAVTSTSLFGLSSWTAAYDEMGEAERPAGAPYYAGSPREETFPQRNWRERDY